MSVKMKIKVTKEILERSASCSFVEYGKELVKFSSLPPHIQEKYDLPMVTTNCAIALAVRELFPTAAVGQLSIIPFSIYSPHFGQIYNPYTSNIDLPDEAIKFIADFDSKSSPYFRTKMPELEFEVDIPDDVIAQLPMPDIKEYLKSSKTLELV